MLFVLLSLISTAFAQAPCIDELGAAKYPQVLVDGHPEGVGVGVFTQPDLFGDPLPALSRLNVRKSIPFFRFNLRWSDAHQFPRSDWPKIIAEAKRIADWVSRHPGPKCYVSGATEHQLNARDAADLARQVLAVIPERCSYVNNPWEGKGAFLSPGPRILNEVHGDKANPPRIGGRFSFSFDGSSSVDSDVEKIKARMRGAEFFCQWHPANNGRLNTNDKTPRPQRKAWPTIELLESLNFLFTASGAVNINPNTLWKSHADRHNTPPEPRAYKPVVITPQKASKLTLKSLGVVVASSGPAQPFQDGRYRYYFPVWGYRMARGPGGPVFELWADNKRLGRVNPGFRAGNFR